MLPSLCVLSDSKLCGNISDTLKQCIDNGADWIGIREYEMDDDKLYSLCEELIKYSEPSGALISIWNKPKIAEELQIGLHIPSNNIDVSIKNNLDFDCPLGISTHNENEISQARGADYITLSPLYDSISKPDYQGMGIDKFSNICSYANMPVFALGGITPENIEPIFENGAYGVMVCGLVMNNPNEVQKFLID